jgi:uncharacterized membrane protein
MSDQLTYPEITREDKMWAALAYLLSPFVPLALLLLEEKKARPFIRYHSVQGLVVGVIIWIMISALGPPTLFCSGFLWFVLLPWGLRALRGETFAIPFVTDFIEKQQWI